MLTRFDFLVNGSTPRVFFVTMDDVTASLRSEDFESDAARDRDELALAHWAKVVAFARQLCRHDGEAEDLAQEAYLRFYSHRARTESRTEGTNDRALLFTIVLNEVRNRARRRSEAALDSELTGVEPEPIDEAIGAEDRQRLVHALARLPAIWRAALFLADGLDASYSEIASVLQTSDDVVRTTLHRARRRLREMLSVRRDRLGGKP